MGARPSREPSASRPQPKSGPPDEGLQRALDAARRENEQLLALYETALGLIHRIDQEELLEAVLQRAARLAGTAHGFIYLRDGPALVMRVGMGFFKSQIGLRVAPGEGLGGRVWQSRAPLVVDDYRGWEGRLPAKVFDEVRSIAGIPLRYRDGVEGVIGLARVEAGRGFSHEEVKLLERFAGLATVALDKARLIAEARNELAERRRTEAILRQSEERYRQLLESLPDPVVVYTLKGEALYVNPAFEQTFGYRREELLGRSIAFVPEENWPETRAAIEALLGGKKVLLETRRRTRQGRLLDVQLTSTLYFDEKGRPAGNIVILRDISGRKEAERRLAESRDALEERVAARTRELASANEALAREVEDRRRAEAKLRRREKQLKAQSLHLQEVNTALRVLLKQREQDRRELGEGVLANVRELIHPYLERLRQARLAPFQKALVDILESNLESIVSPFVSRLSSLHRGLTPTEVRVANLVREGKTNKEIAELLSISSNTVLFHRHNLRTKLGLRNTKRNLRTYLQGITE
ncbi:MAG: PAS domain S-box protein [Desulfobacterales bacterium]